MPGARTGNSKLDNRIRRMDGRYRGLLRKKGRTANRYAIRLRQVLARRSPGGWRWKLLSGLTKKSHAPGQVRL